MPKIKIAPSILAGNFAHMGADVQKITECGSDLIHCDVMDGSFVPPITFGAQMVKQIRPYSGLPLDCHLMILHPETQFEDFARAGADIVTVHYEACLDRLSETMKLIRGYGMKAGAVVNPETPVEKLFDAVEDADMLLVMSVHPGWGGQKFIPESLQKLEKLRNFCIANGKAEMDIEIDGGVTEENVRDIISAGANVIVAGSTVFRAADMRATIANLRKA